MHYNILYNVDKHVSIYISIIYAYIIDKHVGICSGVDKKPITYNTGLTSLLNYGQILPSTVTNIVFAHEFGHNFGSQVS